MITRRQALRQAVAVIRNDPRGPRQVLLSLRGDDTVRVEWRGKGMAERRAKRRRMKGEAA